MIMLGELPFEHFHNIDYTYLFFFNSAMIPLLRSVNRIDGFVTSSCKWLNMYFYRTVITQMKSATHGTKIPVIMGTIVDWKAEWITHYKSQFLPHFSLYILKCVHCFKPAISLTFQIKEQKMPVTNKKCNATDHLRICQLKSTRSERMPSNRKVL